MSDGSPVCYRLGDAFLLLQSYFNHRIMSLAVLGILLIVLLWDSTAFSRASKADTEGVIFGGYLARHCALGLLGKRAQ